MRTAYLVAWMLKMDGHKDVKLWDVLADMEQEFQREPKPAKDVKPDQFAKIGTGRY